jgi:hypothetical protein
MTECGAELPWRVRLCVSRAQGVSVAVATSCGAYTVYDDGYNSGSVVHTELEVPRAPPGAWVQVVWSAAGLPPEPAPPVGDAPAPPTVCHNGHRNALLAVDVWTGAGVPVPGAVTVQFSGVPGSGADPSGADPTDLPAGTVATFSVGAPPHIGGG